MTKEGDGGTYRCGYSTGPVPGTEYIVSSCDSMSLRFLGRRLVVESTLVVATDRTPSAQDPESDTSVDRIPSKGRKGTGSTGLERGDLGLTTEIGS